MQGCHRLGNSSQGKNFFRGHEKSGSFILCQGKLIF